MEPWIQTVLAIFASVMASSGLWAYLQSRRDQKIKQKEKEEEKTSAKNRMILGLGHDRIIWLCQKYIDRGWITKDEYEDLNTYLYTPYRDMGGNGTAEKWMNEVNELPIRNISYRQQMMRTRRKGFFSLMFGKDRS